MALADRTPPTIEEFSEFSKRFNNWGRWGEHDALGTLNHITPEVRRAAASLVRDGRTVSLALVIGANERPMLPSGFEQEMRVHTRGSADRVSFSFHGWSMTHLDALCHVFAMDGEHIYNGRPASSVTSAGAEHGSVEPYREGIVTRGVLYDVARHRGVDHVPLEEPVHGWELQDIADANGIEPRPGDAVVIRSGARAFYAAHPDFQIGELDDMPGAHASVIEFLWETDASLLVWDLLDAGRHGYPPSGDWGGRPAGIPIHDIVIPYMGMPLLDNADLEALSETCASLGRCEFMLTVAPLPIRGGTGSPVNPLAIF